MSSPNVNRKVTAMPLLGVELETFMRIVSNLWSDGERFVIDTMSIPVWKRGKPNGVESCKGGSFWTSVPVKKSITLTDSCV
ncbi:MAG: hypothetical protein HY862_07915 [Chloroflexi bacterium]|nr:hypothetical protein [Chloroflexota bacterium]